MPILFDVGANVGKYTRLLRKNSPDAQIHSFEPGRKTFEMLAKNVSDCNAKLNNFALGKSHKKLILHYDKEGSGLASFYQRQLDYHNINRSARRRNSHA